MKNAVYDFFDPAKGMIQFSMTILPQHCNHMNTLHGGAISTLIDVISSIAIIAMNPNDFVPTVSVDLSVSFAAAAAVNTKILIQSTVLKMGRNLVFTDSVILNHKGQINPFFSYILTGRWFRHSCTCIEVIDIEVFECYDLGGLGKLPILAISAKTNEEKLLALLEQWKAMTGYDSAVLRKMNYDFFDPQKAMVQFSMTVVPELCNLMSNLHGGAIATIIDVVSSISLFAVDPDRMAPSVSVDLSVSYLGAAPLNSKIIIQATALKNGRNLGFTDTTILNEKGMVLAKASHTKFNTAKM
eukprot:gene13673-16101_t